MVVESEEAAAVDAITELDAKIDTENEIEGETVPGVETAELMSTLVPVERICVVGLTCADDCMIATEVDLLVKAAALLCIRGMELETPIRLAVVLVPLAGEALGDWLVDICGLAGPEDGAGRTAVLCVVVEATGGIFGVVGVGEANGRLGEVPKPSEVERLSVSDIAVESLSVLVVGLIDVELVTRINSGSKARATAPSGGRLPGKLTYSCPSENAEKGKSSPNTRLVSLKSHAYPLGCVAPGNSIRGSDPELPFIPVVPSPERNCPSEVNTKIAARSSLGNR